MKLLVLGATGLTGKHVVSQALEPGRELTVLVRDRARLADPSPRLRIVDGDVQNGAALAEAINGQHAVISAIGRGKSFKSENLIARSVPGILAAMQTHGVTRLLFTSALGVGDTYQDSPPLAKLFFRTLLRGIYADKAIGDRLIRNSPLDWTIVQPVVLTEGPLTRQYRVGEHLPLSGMPAISRADTAHFIVGRINDQSTYRKTLIIAH